MQYTYWETVRKGQRGREREVEREGEIYILRIPILAKGGPHLNTQCPSISRCSTQREQGVDYPSLLTLRVLPTDQPPDRLLSLTE